MSKREIYRILDAAANRGREALRVVEDAARFLDDNETLTIALKETRHRFAAASEKLDRRERLLARDTVGDVGVEVEADDEYRRATLLDVLTANFARLQESARSLEEFSKLVAPQLAREWERIRYDSYTLEKMAYEAVSNFDSDDDSDDGDSDDGDSVEAEQDDDGSTREESGDDPNDDASDNADVELSAAPASATEPSRPFMPSFLFGNGRQKTPRERRRERLAQATLSVAVDRALSDADADALFHSNVDVFQFCAETDDAFDEARADAFLRQWNDAFGNSDRPSRKPLLISREFRLWSDAFDGGVVARLDWNVVRDEIGDDVLLGANVSNLNDAQNAFQAGKEGVLDFLEIGPVFASQTSNEPTGAAFLRAVAEACDGMPPMPVFVFGGVSMDNCDELFDSGFDRVLVGSAILDAQDKRAAVLRLKSLF